MCRWSCLRKCKCVCKCVWARPTTAQASPSPPPPLLGAHTHSNHSAHTHRHTHKLTVLKQHSCLQIKSLRENFFQKCAKKKFYPNHLTLYVSIWFYCPKSTVKHQVIMKITYLYKNKKNYRYISHNLLIYYYILLYIIYFLPQMNCDKFLSWQQKTNIVCIVVYIYFRYIFFIHLWIYLYIYLFLPVY